MYRFIVDVMLGKLARWLRVLGWDTAYERDKSTTELLESVRKEGRILLTRRGDLGEGTVIFITSEVLDEQLRQLEASHKIVTDAQPFTRCIECNAVLEMVKKEDIEGQVPFFTYQTREEFWRCPACGKIFWPGSHHEAMMRRVENLKQVSPPPSGTNPLD